MPKFNAQIFIPKFENSGAPIPEGVIGYVAGELRTLGGGVTLSDARGEWADDDGNLYVDELQVVETDVETTADKLRIELGRLASYVKMTCSQEAVYVRIRALEWAEAI